VLAHDAKIEVVLMAK